MLRYFVNVVNMRCERYVTLRVYDWCAVARAFQVTCMLHDCARCSLALALALVMIHIDIGCACMS